MNPLLRVATRADVEAIAKLHALSWREAYRNILTDAYLDSHVEEERRLFWRDRFGNSPAGMWTVLAESPDGVLAGFLCLLAEHDVRWGTLIDNLHVHPERKGRSMGRAMMQAAADHLTHTKSTKPLHLFVGKHNQAAQAFYRKLGGESVEQLVHDQSDGSRQPVLRFVWPGPLELAAMALLQRSGGR